MIGQLWLLAATKARCRDDRLQLFFSLIQIVVYQNKVIATPMADFIPAFFHTPANGFCIVLTTLFEAIAKFRNRRRQ